MFEVRLKGPWSKTLKDLRNMYFLVPQATNKVVKFLSKAALARLRLNMRLGKGADGLSEGTKLWRAKGKKAGTGASKSPWVVGTYSGNQPLLRSETLIKSTWRRPKGKFAYIIEIRPGRLSPEGRPMRRVAIDQEFGVLHNMQISQKMMAYLLILYGRITPKGTGKPKSVAPTRRTLRIRVPARPVWRITRNELEKELPPIADKLYAKYMKMT